MDNILHPKPQSNVLCPNGLSKWSSILFIWTTCSTNIQSTGTFNNIEWFSIKWISSTYQPDDNANRNLELNWAWYSNGSSSPNPTNVYPTESFTDVRLPMKCCGGTLARYCHNNNYDSFRWVIISSTFKTKTIPRWILLNLHWLVLLISWYVFHSS